MESFPFLPILSLFDPDFSLIAAVGATVAFTKTPLLESLRQYSKVYSCPMCAGVWVGACFAALHGISLSLGGVEDLLCRAFTTSLLALIVSTALYGREKGQDHE